MDGQRQRAAPSNANVLSGDGAKHFQRHPDSQEEQEKGEGGLLVADGGGGGEREREEHEQEYSFIQHQHHKRAPSSRTSDSASIHFLVGFVPGIKLNSQRQSFPD
jgi:hypothetical protein